MDNGYMVDGYLNDNATDATALKDKNPALELSKLRTQINNTGTVTELMIEVSLFLEETSVSDEIKNSIVSICDSFDENIDVYTAKNKLDLYISGILEKEYSNYVEQDTNNAISNYDTNFDGIDEVVEGPIDDIFIEESANGELILSSEKPILFETKNDGTIQVNGDYNDKNSMNFAAMMTMSLLVTNKSKIVPNLDMKLIKNNNDIDRFRIIYGNFPLINHPENRLDSAIISQITKLTEDYESDVNYMQLLEKASPEIKEAMDIVYKYVLNRHGSFQMAIRNNYKNHDMAFGMDNNYNDVLDAFNTNGAYVSYDENERGIATVNETIPGNQLLILNSTSETLKVELEKKNNEEIANRNQYIKKLESNEVANINYPLLIIIAVVEVLLVSIYFIFMFNK